MDCLNCGNCKENQPTYYCLARNEVVINENYVPEDKERTGWKKGTKNYEIHRRKTRKEVEV
ncbi:MULTISPECIES: hypothetical protein [Sporanaerobacter]|jgi:hypothetical protein|uniref:Uncharacterized protein n=1 Tax=Sporanaerobacter acetigenes DSM 13106 TaxID=1123281 RepID=A0A1M5UVP1_9FIRM|nr:hypothetical protein [Sporanaerobacter acetigenes]SHH67045.1 hypothetical protein SAMN02745180_00786 [Sporanaerobacter acetigenes DSM 13106]